MKWIVIGLATIVCASVVRLYADSAQKIGYVRTDAGYISASEAVQEVRDFENDPGLAVTVTDYPSQSRGLTDVGRHYVLSAGQYTYHVGSRYLTVTRTLDAVGTNNGLNKATKAGSAGHSADVEAATMDQAKAQSIAYQYMSDHFAEPATAMSLHDASCTMEGDQAALEYSFTWFALAGNGFIGPAVCTVTVDGESGSVTDYIGDDFPPPASTYAQLTPAQGIADAAQAIGYVPDGTPAVTWAGIIPPDDLGDEELFYDINLPGYAYGDSTTWEIWYVRIDANTGAILATSVQASLRPKDSVDLTGEQKAGVRRSIHIPYPKSVGRELDMTVLGRKGLLDRPALLIQSVPYVYARYAEVAASVSAEIGPSRLPVAFQPGTDTYTIDGATRHLRHRPVFEAGACYIPIELADVIAPGRFVYDAKARTVDYRPTATTKQANSAF